MSSRGLLRSLLPDNESESNRITDLSSTMDVARSEQEETTAESSDVNNIAENTDELAHDVKNMNDADDVMDDVSIKRVLQLAKRLSSEVITLEHQ